jgi:hypothetical protein
MLIPYNCIKDSFKLNFAFLEMISPCKNRQFPSLLMLDCPQRISHNAPGMRWDSHTATCDAAASTKITHNSSDGCIGRKHGELDFLHSSRSQPDICHRIMQCLKWCQEIENGLRPIMHENHRSFQDWKVRIKPLQILLVLGKS